MPQGGVKAGETYEEAARREWLEESGIPLCYIRWTGLYSRQRCRYLAVWVEATPTTPTDEPLPPRPDPDFHPAGEYTYWAPPHEDQEDTDPIVEASWRPLSAILQCSTGLGRDRREVIAEAREDLRPLYQATHCEPTVGSHPPPAPA